MKKIARGLSMVLSAGVFCLLGLTVYAYMALPDSFTAIQGETLVLPSGLPVQICLEQGTRPAYIPVWENTQQPKSARQATPPVTASLKLFNRILVKDVSVQTVSRKMVVPCGNPFGIKMFTDGVMIVGMSDIQIGSSSVNPSKQAGLKIGDLLVSINGEPVMRNEDVAQIIAQSAGQEVRVAVLRGGEKLEVGLTPVQTEYDHVYRAGVWVRDSSAGIGTMTYFDPETLGFAGLGHAICDVDTGKIMPLSSGEIVAVNVTGINAGQSGKPGELRGAFVNENAVGSLLENTELGIFGRLHFPCVSAEPIPMAVKQEVQPGAAQIYATISGSRPQGFDVVIEKVNYSDNAQSKNMVVHVVDEGLLSATGGIVQGMSGSPIVQEGKLVGAVTHVFVNDPTRGYAVFSENMDKILNNVEKNKKAA